jgi:ribonuclease J
MAYRDHRQIELHDGDTVVFSATSIPGNERAVNETINRLYQIGCDVITTDDAPIHASGHGYQEEIKLMLNLTKPTYVMPFHGDHKRIKLHGDLAIATGVDAANIFSGENGLPLEIDERGARFGKPERAGMIYVDGVDIGDPADVALRDRKMLSGDGIFVVVATVSEQDGLCVADPEIIFRGVAYSADAEALHDDIREAVEDSVEAAAKQGVREPDLVAQHLHDDLAKFVYDKLRKRPMVLPVVVEV